MLVLGCIDADFHDQIIFFNFYQLPSTSINADLQNQIPIPHFSIGSHYGKNLFVYFSLMERDLHNEKKSLGNCKKSDFFVFIMGVHYGKFSLGCLHYEEWFIRKPSLWKKTFSPKKCIIFHYGKNFFHNEKFVT